MSVLGPLLIFAPLILNALAQITCNEMNNMNNSNTYDYLEEVFEMDCSLY
jgi:hypothetical protein